MVKTTFPNTYNPPKGFAVVKMNFLNSYRLSMCFVAVKTVLPNYYNHSTGLPVVKKSLTEPLQASTHVSVVKMDFANFYKPTNALAEHLQAFNVLCRSQDGTDESPRSFNRLPCSHNWLVEPLQALFCSQNGLSEPLEAFNWSKRPCRTPTILQKASWQSKRTFRTSTILQHASW